MPAAVRGEGAEALPWGLLLLSFVATAFGNSLEPISALAALQPALLLHLYRRLEEGRQRAATGPGTGAQAQCAARRGRRLLSLVLVAPTQALAWTVAFAGLFKIGGWSAPGLATVLAISLLLWLPLAVVVLQAAVAFRERFPASPGRLFVFPCLWTAVYTVVSATPLSSMTNPAYGLLDHRPFALLASLLGVHGLNFMLALACAAAEDAFHLHCSSSSTAGSRPEQRQIPALHGQKTSVALALLALLIYGGAWGHIDTFYQRDVEATAAPAELSASCILGSPAGGGDLAWQLQQTAERVAAGDDIILWSEAAVAVASPEEEEDLLARASALQLQQQQEEEESSSSGNSSYIGVSYFVTSESRNMFVLLAPDGSAAWRYQKAHPVPFQLDGKPGPARLPIHDSPKFGRFAGAICFDMDFPSYLRQAGSAGVDLLLQPSNTWGPIGAYHFRENALRAVENGFTHVRCNSGGFSGVATPLFDFVHHTASLSRKTLLFSVPLRRHTWTPYASGGLHLLEWLNLAAAVCMLAMLCIPTAALLAARQSCLSPLCRLMLATMQRQPDGLLSGEAGEEETAAVPLLPSLPVIQTV